MGWCFMLSPYATKIILLMGAHTETPLWKKYGILLESGQPLLLEDREDFLLEQNS